MNWKIGTLLVVGVAVVSVGLSLFVTGYWSTEISESSGAVAAVSESEGDGLHDGIKIHGEYEIEVREPDGTLVASTALSNEITPQGKHAITNAMNGESGVFAGWSMTIAGTPMPCVGTCHIRPGSTQYTEHEPAQNTMSKSASGTVLTLTGSYVAGDPEGDATGGTLTHVRTFFNPNNAGNNYWFSNAVLPGGPQYSGPAAEPITFTKGQTINVTYTVSVN